MHRLPELTVDLVAAAQTSSSPLADLNTARLEAIQVAYRRFLYLAARYPELSLAPTVEIDEMWHLHMLHPEAYHRDCLGGVGYLVDHNAGFGATAEEQPALLADFQMTSELWASTFGEAYGLVCGLATSGGDTTNCNKDPEPTNCNKSPEPTNCNKIPEPTNCNKAPEPTNCNKTSEPTNCNKAPSQTPPLTNCNKAENTRCAGEGWVSVDLAEAARRSNGSPLADLSMEAFKAGLAGYEAFLMAGLDRPEDPLVYEIWRLHMLHPVAYRHDCVERLGSVKDHAVDVERALV